MEKFIIIFATGLILIIFALLISGIVQYEGYGAKVGTVIDKQYTSENFYITTKTQYIENKTISIPEYHHEPAKWKIKLQKLEADKEKTIWIEVTEEEYKNLKIGEYYGE